MRLKIRCQLEKDSRFPFNYSYEMQSVIYSLIRKSSSEFSEFLHKTGYVDEKRNFKLFTFSKLFFDDGYVGKDGFSRVTSFYFIFSTPIKKSFEHLVLGIFSDQRFVLRFGADHSIKALISTVESLPEIGFTNEMKFLCLSPIAVTTGLEQNGRMVQHYLDYMNPKERERYQSNIHSNLVKKYRLINGIEYSGDTDFDLTFDIDYILKRKGNIRKNIKFKTDPNSKKSTYIIGMEAPFTIKADPELIKAGYETGFGEKNSAGFGMVERVEE